MTTALAIRPMVPCDFEPFGEVFSLEDSERRFEINDGLATRCYDIATLDLGDSVERPVLSVFLTRANASRFEIELLERHPLGSQAFVPLQPVDWVVVVARERVDGTPGEPAAFRPPPRHGVNIGRGVWHYPLITRTDSRFLVIDGGVRDDNLEIHRFAGRKWELELPD